MKTAARLLVCALLAYAPAVAQRPFSGTPELLDALDRLQSTGSALMIAAHPDDENTALLAWLARGLHVRTGYLSLTRGEGGQNAIGSEQGHLLGVIRTQELLEARRVDGAEQFFTSAVDFGYSKTAEEAIRIWGREKTVGEIVRVIREFRPDVLLLIFSGTPRDGHGQHQASALLAREAWEAAGDPRRFPGVGPAPWRAPRVVWTPWWRENLPPHSKVDLGAYNPVLGYSYTEIAGISRSLHRSQAMGVPQSKGTAEWALVPVAGEPFTAGMFEGIDTTWKRVPGGGPVGELLARARREFRPEAPHEIVPVLVDALKAMREVDAPGLERRREHLERAIALAAGLTLEAHVDVPEAPAGTQVKVQRRAIVRSPAAVSIGGETLKQNITRTEFSTLPAGSAPSVWLDATIGGVAIRYDLPLVHRYVDHVYGERVRPFAVVPAVTAQFTCPALLFPDTQPRELTIETSPGADVQLSASAHWRVEKISDRRFRVWPPAFADSGSSRVIRLGPPANSVPSVRRIAYPHIETQVVLEPATAKLVRADVRTLAKTVGYVMGAGDQVPDALEQIGCTVTPLVNGDLASGDLNRFDAIVTGIRAWSEREDLRAARQRLFDWVHRGGTLVVQYNVLERGAAPLDIAPHALKIGRERVSVEDAPVKIVAPESPLLTSPNRITADDFAGWVQERGLYFAAEWSPEYTPLLEMADPGEKPLRGALLVARHGKGVYIFTGLSFFRQLPAGVPGAYRLFANLISAGKTQ